jgi:hypothetical protein
MVTDYWVCIVTLTRGAFWSQMVPRVAGHQSAAWVRSSQGYHFLGISSRSLLRFPVDDLRVRHGVYLP